MRNFIFLLVVVILAGCWDSKEINNFSYVLGIGIDRTDSGEIQLTYQIADLKQEGETKNITATGKSFAEAQRKINSMSGKEVNLEQTRVIVLGEILVSQDISEFMQSAFRDLHIRSSTPVTIAKGTAADVLELKTDMFVDLTANNEAVLTDSNILDITKNIWQQSDYLIQITERTEAGFEIVGGAIFRENKMVGILPLENIADYKLLTHGMKRIGMDIELEGVDVVLQGISTKTEAILQGDSPKMKIEITGKYSIEEKEYIDDEVYLEKIDKLLNDNITNKCQEVIEIGQKQTGADFLGFWRKFKNQHRPWWDKEGTHWREILPSVPIEINVNIRRVS